MENKNPNIVLDTVIGDEQQFQKFKLQPLTIFRYAILERISSPFIRSDQDFTVDNIVPSVFVMATDKGELKKFGRDMEKLREAALDWADENLVLDEMPQVIKAIVGILTDVNKAAPSGTGGEDDGKKN